MPKRSPGRPSNPPAPRVRLKAVRWPNALRRLRLSLTFDGTRSANQYQIARAIGIGLPRYWDIEKGRRPATPREAKELAKLFNVTERELLVDVQPSTRVTARKPKLRRAS